MARVSYETWCALFEDCKQYNVDEDRYVLHQKACKAFLGEEFDSLQEVDVDEESDELEKFLNQTATHLLNKFSTLCPQEKRLLKYCLSHIIDISDIESIATLEQHLPKLYARVKRSVGQYSILEDLSDEEAAFEAVRNEVKATNSVNTTLNLDEEASLQGQIKQIFSTVLINLTSSRKRKRNAEYTYVNKVTNLLDLVVGTSDLYLEPGETTSAATKMIRVANGHFFGWSSSGATSTNNLSDRKTDILLMDGEDVELAVYEFKTEKCSTSTKASDDCKATRFNKFIKEVSVRDGVTEDALSMSWSGNSGKLYMMKKVEGVDVGVGLEDLVYPATKDEALSEAFKKTIMPLFKIKKSSKQILDRFENTDARENVPVVFLSPKPKPRLL